MSQTKPRKGSIWDWIWKDKDKEKEKEKNERERDTRKDDRVVNSNSNSQFEQSDSASRSAISSKLSAKATDISDDLLKARSIIADIEKIIQSEIETPDPEKDELIKQSDSNSSSKKKRPGPKLIRPLNKRKTRMVVGEMIFDPNQNVWIGNEKDGQIFKQPALITHMGSLSPQEYGGMVYDPDLKIWKGNEKILRRFRSIRRPKLIAPNETIVGELEQNGMKFDPETMTWKGNEEDVLDLVGLETSETERQFKVGNEFNLSPEMKESFRRSEDAHRKNLRGWFKDKPGVDRHVHSHLSLIRNMSIMKIINLAKQTPQLSSSLDSVPSARPRALSGTDSSTSITNSPIRMYAHRTISAPGTPKFSSDEDDWNDIELPKSPKLKLTVSAPALKVEAAVDEDSDKSTEKPKRSRSLVEQLSRFKEKEETNDDLDLTSFSPATLKSKVSASKLRVSDAEDSGLSSDGEHLDDDDDFESEEWDGLDVPETPLSLRKLSDASSDANFSEGEREDFKQKNPLTKSGESTLSGSSIKSIDDDSSVNEIVLKTPIKRSPASAEIQTVIEDEISGLEIPSSGLKLRPRAPSSVELESHEEDEENWDEFAISEDIVEKLKSLPLSLVTSPPIIRQATS